MVSDSKRNKKPGSWKEMAFSVLVVVLFIVLVIFLIVTNFKVGQKREGLQSRINELKREIQVLEEKNEQLKQEMSQSESQEYVEKVAKEQLGMKAPGEEVVVISKEGQEEQSAFTGSQPDAAGKANFWNPKTWWNWLTGK